MQVVVVHRDRQLVEMEGPVVAAEVEELLDQVGQAVREIMEVPEIAAVPLGAAEVEEQVRPGQQVVVVRVMGVQAPQILSQVHR
jgi:hypothetical protein